MPKRRADLSEQESWERISQLLHAIALVPLKSKREMLDLYSEPLLALKPLVKSPNLHKALRSLTASPSVHVLGRYASGVHCH